MAGFGGDRRGKNSCFRGEINGINCQFFLGERRGKHCYFKGETKGKNCRLMRVKEGGGYYFQGEIHGITKGQKLPVYRGERRGSYC